MRRCPWPLSVTSPPPSRTTRGVVLTTLAVRRMAMVTGCGPQSNATTPPRATARTTAREVHDPGVPVPTTVSAVLDVTELRAEPSSSPLANDAGAADAHAAATSTAARTPAAVTA